MKRIWRIFDDAFDRFNINEGWAIASHIAMSVLMALFPFLIFVTALAASLFGSRELANETASILLEAWPEVIAAPRGEPHRSPHTSIDALSGVHPVVADGLDAVPRRVHRVLHPGLYFLHLGLSGCADFNDGHASG